MNRNHAQRGRRGITRRSLLSNLSLGLGAAAVLPQLSLRRAFAATDPTFLVVVNLFGGNDSMNAYVPYGLGAYYDARPHVAIPANTVLPITTGEGLHPALSAIHGRYASGDLAIVRQVGYPNPNLSHFESQDIWTKGFREIETNREPRGWIGRAADLYFPGALDVVGVGVGRRPDFIANTAKPLAIDALSSYGPGDRAVPWWELSHRDGAARAMLAAGAATEVSPAKDLRRSLRNAYDLADVIRAADTGYTSPVVYPDSYLASQFQDVAKLVKASLGGRIYYTGIGGWDTHADQAGQHADLLGQVGGALQAFSQDLESMQAWDRAAIVVISEFGRRNYDNASGGTDHGHGMNLLVMGGAVHGGVYGPAYTTSTIVDNEEIPGAVDYRAVYSNLLRHHLGVDPSGVFTEPWSGDQEVPLY